LIWLHLLKIKDRAGRQWSSFSRQQLRLWRAASTYSYKNEKQQASLKKRAHIRESHCALAPFY